MQQPGTALEDSQYRYILSIEDIVIDPTDGTSVAGLHTPPNGKTPGKIQICGTLNEFDFLATLTGEVWHAGEFAEEVKIDDKVLHTLARYYSKVIRLNPQYARYLGSWARKGPHGRSVR